LHPPSCPMPEAAPEASPETRMARPNGEAEPEPEPEPVAEPEGEIERFPVGPPALAPMPRSRPALPALFPSPLPRQEPGGGSRPNGVGPGGRSYAPRPPPLTSRHLHVLLFSGGDRGLSGG